MSDEFKVEELHVSFRLSEAEVATLRAAFHNAAAVARLEHEPELVSSARQHVQQALARHPLEFIAKRLIDLEEMIDMLEDKDWILPGSVRRRLLTMLAYFGDPGGIVPDDTPAFGYLDDALLIELLRAEIAEELEGYAEFERFRERARGRSNGADDGARLEHALALQRKRLRARIQGQRMRRQPRIIPAFDRPQLG